MKNFILTLVIAIVSSVNVFGQTINFISKDDENNYYSYDIEDAGIQEDDYYIWNVTTGNNILNHNDSLWKFRTFTYELSNTSRIDSVKYEEKIVYIYTSNSINSENLKFKVIFNDYIALDDDSGNSGDPSVSVGSQPEVSNLMIYPNPVQDVLNIRFDSYETVDVVVTDLNGRIVFNEASSVSASVDLSNQPSGIYLVKVGSETRKVVKQ